VDDDADDCAMLVSAAKATMSDLFRRSSAEALQLHGGIGMTDEAAPGLYVKRARWPTRCWAMPPTTAAASPLRRDG